MSGIALVSQRRGKRVENETACLHSQSSKSNERYSNKKNTSQVQLVKLLSRVQLFETPWTVAYQAPPSMGFSRQEY